MQDPAIRLSHVRKVYKIYDRPQDRLKQTLWRGMRQYFREFEALHDVSLSVARGETLGIVGRNGSGKSTLLQVVCGTLTPTSGDVEVRGRLSALLELGAGFNPEFSGRENVFLNGAILGLSEREVAERYDAIAAFSGLDAAHLAQPVKTYSSGMYVRLAFAVAAAVNPEVLVVDEALAVGDEAFQRKCFSRIRDLQAQGTTVLFVSHSAQTVIELCTRAVLMDEGEVITQGTPKDVIAAYHELIYAESERQPEIRNRIKTGQKVQAAKSEAALEAFDRSLASESVVYAPNGGTISNPRLTTVDGKPVNILQTGEIYQLHYDVALTDPAERMQFGMMVRTVRGLELTGGLDTSLMQQGKTLPAGARISVAFTFRCPLRPETYFINCGCTKRVNGEDVFVHRIVDAIHIKVIAAQATHSQPVQSTGLIDLGAQCALEIAR